MGHGRAASILASNVLTNQNVSFPDTGNISVLCLIPFSGCVDILEYVLENPKGTSAAMKKGKRERERERHRYWEIFCAVNMKL